MIGLRVLAAVTLLSTAGCMNLRPVFDPARFITENHPPVVYVMRGTEAVLTISNPRVSGDTVHGTLVGENQPIAMPLREVQNIGTVRFNSARTVMLVGAAAVVSALMTYTLLTRGAGDMKVCVDGDNATIDDWCELNR